MNKTDVIYLSLMELSMQWHAARKATACVEPGFCPGKAGNSIKEIAFNKCKVGWENRNGEPLSVSDEYGELSNPQ